MKEDEKRTENNRIKRTARIYSDIHSFWIQGWIFLEMWQPIYGWNIRSLNKEVDCLI